METTHALARTRSGRLFPLRRWLVGTTLLLSTGLRGQPTTHPSNDDGTHSQHSWTAGFPSDGYVNFDQLEQTPWLQSENIANAARQIGAEFQAIPYKGGAGLTYDHYGVHIDSLPSGVSAETILAGLRKSPSDGANNSVFSFLSTFKHRDQTPDGIGGVFDIDIAGPANGSVMIVDSKPNYFIVQTLDTSKSGGGPHIERGSRVFGFTADKDGGGYTFYTRGVSVPSDSYAIVSPAIRKVQSVAWHEFIQGIAATLENRGAKIGEFTYKTHTPTVEEHLGDISEKLSYLTQVYAVQQKLLIDLSSKPDPEITKMLAHEQGRLKIIETQLLQLVRDKYPGAIEDVLKTITDLRSERRKGPLTPEESARVDEVARGVLNQIRRETEASRGAAITLLKNPNRDPAELKKFADSINAASQVADISTTIIGIFDPGMAAKIATIANAEIGIAKGAVQLYAGNYLGGVNDIAKGVASLCGMRKRDVGAERHRQLMEALHAIRLDIAATHKEVVECRLDIRQLRAEAMQQFESVQKQLEHIQADLQQAFTSTFEQLDEVRAEQIRQSYDIAELKRLVEFYGTLTADAIADLKYTDFLNNIERMSRPRPSENGKPIELTGIEKEAIVLSFLRHARDTASSPLMNGSRLQASSFQDSEHAEFIRTRPIERRFATLGVLFGEDGLGKLDSSLKLPAGLANPIEFTLGARAYLAARTSFRGYDDPKTLADVDSLLKIAEALHSVQERAASREFQNRAFQAYAKAIRSALSKIDAVSSGVIGFDIDSIDVAKGSTGFELRSRQLSQLAKSPSSHDASLLKNSREAGTVKIRLPELPEEARLFVDSGLGALQANVEARGVGMAIDPDAPKENGNGHGHFARAKGDISVSIEVWIYLADVNAKVRKIPLYKVDSKLSDFEADGTFEGNGLKHVALWSGLNSQEEFFRAWSGDYSFIQERPIPSQRVPNNAKAMDAAAWEKLVRGDRENQLKWAKEQKKDTALGDVIYAHTKPVISKESVKVLGDLLDDHYSKEERKLLEACKSQLSRDKDLRDSIRFLNVCSSAMQTLAECSECPTFIQDVKDKVYRGDSVLEALQGAPTSGDLLKRRRRFVDLASELASWSSSSCKPRPFLDNSAATGVEVIVRDLKEFSEMQEQAVRTLAAPPGSRQFDRN